jgi:hypothetical protein
MPNEEKGATDGSRPMPAGLEGSELQVTQTLRDYTKMTERQLLREGRLMYSGLQAIWCAELNYQARTRDGR